MTTKIVYTPAGFVEPDDLVNSTTPNSNGLGRTMATPEMSRVHSGAVRWSASGDVESAGPTRHVHQGNSGTTGGSVAATLNATYGRPSVELTPGNPSSRVSVETAQRQGLIRRNAAGQWEDVQAVGDSAMPSDDAASEEAAGDPGADLYDPATDALWAEDLEPLPQHAYDSAVASLVNVAAHGTGSLDDTAKSLALNAGIPPELADEYVRYGYAIHERAVELALAPLGIKGDRLSSFYEAARAHPTKLQDAIQRLVHMRDPSGFKSLAVAFKVSKPVDVSVYTAAGFETTIDRDTGDVMLKRPGGNWVQAKDLK